MKTGLVFEKPSSGLYEQRSKGLEDPLNTCWALWIKTVPFVSVAVVSTPPANIATCRNDCKVLMLLIKNEYQS